MVQFVLEIMRTDFKITQMKIFIKKCFFEMMGDSL